MIVYLDFTLNTFWRNILLLCRDSGHFVSPVKTPWFSTFWTLKFCEIVLHIHYTCEVGLWSIFDMSFSKQVLNFLESHSKFNSISWSIDCHYISRQTTLIFTTLRVSCQEQSSCLERCQVLMWAVLRWKSVETKDDGEITLKTHDILVFLSSRNLRRRVVKKMRWKVEYETRGRKWKTRQNSKKKQTKASCIVFNAHSSPC